MKTFAFNGYERVSIQSLFYSIKNNFTYEFLTKPEAMHQIDKESSEGCSGIQGQKYVISPEHGQHENEAGVGVSIGINGVSVYEHSENYLPATAVYPAFFDDWVHVAVVYNNKTPSIYINGQFVKTGVTSLKENVFASGVFGGHNPYGFFVGQLKYIRLWDHSRTKEQIRESISQDLIGNEQGLFGYWNFDDQSFSELITNDDVVSVRDHRDGILFVMNQLGGGTELYQNTYIEKIKDQYKVYKLMFQSDSYLFEDINEENYSHILIKSLDLTQKKFINLLNSLNIKLIYVNHLISFQVYEIMDLIQYSGIEYNYFIHDFYCACPRVNLINKNGIYCNNEVGVSKCQNCMNNFQNISIETWRQRFLSFLLGAHKVIAPSYSTKEIIKKYYPGVSIDVHEHSVSSTIKNTNKSIFAKNKILNIAFIGYIHKIKGSRILYQMMKIIRMKNLPIRIIVIGRTDMHDKFISDDKKFIVTGKYDNTEISELLAKHKISLVISSSVCPETYSYTTSEALLSGYPVITFNIGAPAERVRKLGGGWILEKVNSSSIINLLIKLLDNRNEIIQKANNLRK